MNLKGNSMTPVQEAGYKIGQKFEYVGDGNFAQGSILELIKDDDSATPLFKLLSGKCYVTYSGKAAHVCGYANLVKIKLLEEVKVEYKYVPANLTVDTFIDRVRAGEVFYGDSTNGKFYYDNDKSNPFRYDEMDLIGNWDLIPTLTIRVETTWEDEVSEENPILCWVSDTSTEEKLHAVWVDYACLGQKFPYRGLKGLVYKYATPVLPTECRPVKD